MCTNPKKLLEMELIPIDDTILVASRYIRIQKMIFAYFEFDSHWKYNISDGPIADTDYQNPRHYRY